MAEWVGTLEAVARGLLLLIDTSGVDGSLALAEMSGGGRVLRVAAMAGRSSSERLLPELRAMLAAEGVGPGDLRAIAVVRGPGSFTGVRIGVAATKGLAEGLGVPVIGLSRLAMVASAAGGTGEVAVLLDAGRGEVFYGRYREGGEVMLGEALLTREAAMEACAGVRVVACEDGVIEAMAGLGVERVAAPNAGAGLRLAMARVARGEVEDVAALDAHYLRRTSAELAAEGGRGVGVR